MIKKILPPVLFSLFLVFMGYDIASSGTIAMKMSSDVIEIGGFKYFVGGFLILMGIFLLPLYIEILNNRNQRIKRGRSDKERHPIKIKGIRL